MRPDRKRFFAWMVLGACALAGIFGLGGLHLQRSRAAVLDVFYGGAAPAQDGQTSMNALLNRAGRCAQTMAAEALYYLGTDDDAARRMLSSADSLCTSAEINDRHAAYMRIRSEADALLNAMYALNILDGERVNFKRAYDDFWRCDHFIRRDPYREMAAQYNRSIQAFPASMVAAVAGTGELNSFGG